MSNDFLPFCPTNTGTNLLSQSDYLAATDRTDGNQPGVASAKLVNKALRQGTYITSQIAQFLANITGTSAVDDATPAKLLSQMVASLQFFPPTITEYAGAQTTTHNISYLFFIATGNATAAATYTNNAVTFTVVDTIASGTVLKATGPGAPSASGTLTKASGSGDATLTFYSVRAPLWLKVQMVGAGGGGAGSGGTTGTAATSGTASTFGTTLLTANGGALSAFSSAGGDGGTASLGSGPKGVAVTGARGCGYSSSNLISGSNSVAGGTGGVSPLGGAGAGGSDRQAGSDAKANTGSGGGGAGGLASIAYTTGGGGGAGGWISAVIKTVLSTYAVVVGTGGTGGAAGSTPTGNAGGAGADGQIYVEEHYQ